MIVIPTQARRAEHDLWLPIAEPVPDASLSHYIPWMDGVVLEDFAEIANVRAKIGHVVRELWPPDLSEETVVSDEVSTLTCQ